MLERNYTYIIDITFIFEFIYVYLKTIGSIDAFNLSLNCIPNCFYVECFHFLYFFFDVFLRKSFSEPGWNVFHRDR